jgi:hypothetical protein
VEEGYACQEVPDSDKRHNDKRHNDKRHNDKRHNDKRHNGAPDGITGVCARMHVCAMVVRACDAYMCVCACLFDTNHVLSNTRTFIDLRAAERSGA